MNFWQILAAKLYQFGSIVKCYKNKITKSSFERFWMELFEPDSFNYNLYFCICIAMKFHHPFLFQDTGIMKAVGEAIFKEIFHIKTKDKAKNGSITFVVDVTGSMGDDIQAVKEATTKIVLSLGPVNKPADYVLVTFSDPGTHMLYLCYHAQI